MRIKKILSLAVVLAMVLTVVPMFGLTASAAEAYGEGDAWFAVEFDLVKTGWRDIGLTNKDGKVFAAFANAWTDGDGFYPGDGDRSFNNSGDRIGDGQTAMTDPSVRTSFSGGSITYDNCDGKARIRIVAISGDGNYEVKYYLVDPNNSGVLQIASATYVGTLNGIQDVSGWSQGQGSANPTYENVAFFSGSDKNNIVFDDTTLKNGTLKAIKGNVFVQQATKTATFKPGGNANGNPLPEGNCTDKGVEYRKNGTLVAKGSGDDAYIYHSGWNQCNGLVGFTVPKISEGEKVLSAKLALKTASTTNNSNMVTVGEITKGVEWNTDTYKEPAELGFPGYSTSSGKTELGDFKELDSAKITHGMFLM